MTPPKARKRKRGVVVEVERNDWSEPGQDFALVWTRRASGQESATVCYPVLRRAGLKPLKPGEARKVRVIVEEAK